MFLKFPYSTKTNNTSNEINKKAPVSSLSDKRNKKITCSRVDKHKVCETSGGGG